MLTLLLIAGLVFLCWFWYDLIKYETEKEEHI